MFEAEQVRAEDGAGPTHAPAGRAGLPRSRHARPSRLLGEVASPRPRSCGWPTVVITGGLHGNEPAGVGAARAVLEELERGGHLERGRVVAFAGNLPALERGVRYVDRDLNRMWTPADVRRVLAFGPSPALAEDGELFELFDLLDGEIDGAEGPVLLLDLHSTSAPGAPFCVVPDTLFIRGLMRTLPVPTILGLEERIDGPLLSWFASRGHPALVVEGGQNEAPSTRVHLEAAVWLALAGVGMVARDLAPVRASYRRLRAAARERPGVLEVLHAHRLRAGDGFEMLPGFVNFQRVRAGELVARDSRGEIRAPWDGHILMPLYQGQGEDGFFLARELSRTWLFASGAMRARGLDGFLATLPGVRRHPARPAAVLVERDGMRPLTLAFLRMFGYRRRRRAGALWMFERRVEGPASFDLRDGR